MTEAPTTWNAIAEETVGRLKPGPIRVLDVGCGRKRDFALPEGAYVVGVDNSPEALELNDVVDEKALCDIERDRLPDGRFDIVTCCMVLEHVSDPQPVLDQMRDRLAPGGLLVVAVPTVFSVKGLAAKLTPHWFHVAVGRRFLGYVHAGELGFPPFRTYLNTAIAPAKMKTWAARSGLHVVVEEYLENPHQRRIRTANAATRALWAVTAAVHRLLTGGRVEAHLTDVLIVLQRPE